jgi:hypothetical protein
MRVVLAERPGDDCWYAETLQDSWTRFRCGARSDSSLCVRCKGLVLLGRAKSHLQLRCVFLWVLLCRCFLSCFTLWLSLAVTSGHAVSFWSFCVRVCCTSPLSLSPLPSPLSPLPCDVALPLCLLLFLQCRTSFPRTSSHGANTPGVFSLTHSLTCSLTPAALADAPFALQDVIPEDKQPELLGTISKGNITMRVLRDIFDSFVNMGPLSQVGSQVGVCVWGGGILPTLKRGGCTREALSARATLL